ncbi:Uncharacterised protein [Mycobacteroides abscessus subsp. abscessus]|nr:Uncharacterised protein [Mycobacteroides abscessus subsp. abscessus]
MALNQTITSGKTSRMPKTAISTPMVKKIFCQNALMRRSTVALMTALSKESDTSRMPRMSVRNRAVGPP